MTCREKLHTEYPEIPEFVFKLMRSSIDHWGCPHNFGYARPPKDCTVMTCIRCWDREVEED